MTNMPIEPAADGRRPSVDPALVALLDLEERTGQRRLDRLAHIPLAALRELEQRTGSPLFVFGPARPGALPTNDLPSEG